MSENYALKGVYLNDFSRLRSIEGIEKAPSLEIFGIGNAVWDKAEIESYAPLRNSTVKEFVFRGKKILDTDFSFTADMKNLENFCIPSSTLTTAQFAWIAANCPKLKDDCTKGVKFFKSTDKDDNPCTMFYGVGKGMRSCKLEGNESKMQKLLSDFEKLKAQLKDAPYPI